MIPPGGTAPAAGTPGTATSTGGMVPPQPGAFNGFPTNGFGYGGYGTNPWTENNNNNNNNNPWGGGGWAGFGNPWGNNNPYYYNYGQNPNTNNFDSNTGKGTCIHHCIITE